MLKQILICIPIVLLIMTPWGAAQDGATEPADVHQKIKALEDQNKKLTEKVNALEEDVKGLPVDTHLSYRLDDTVHSGFIRKGDLTGAFDKLMNVNLFMGARYSAINNNASMNPDVDGFSTPFARLHLTGQAYKSVFYTASFEFTDFNDGWLYQYPNFNDDNLYEASLSWKPEMGDCPALNRFQVTAGLTKTFLSPAGESEVWQQEFIEYPLMVYRLLPPGLNRDIGAYMYGDCLDEGRLKFWLGCWNGAHRQISMAGTNFNTVNAYDAWGNGGSSDQLSLMARAQLDVFDEDNLFLMFSGAFERGTVNYTESVGAGPITVHDFQTDSIFAAATEIRFNDRNTWAKGEYMHTHVENANAPTQEGGYIAVGHLLAPFLENLEVAARMDKVKIDDHQHIGNDLTNYTAGVNFYFDPEHKHDAKVQLNYVIRKESGNHVKDNAVILQFVLGF